ncbi:MAG: hypothetical protein H7Y04_09355 [Verrucomicrobia bacterium]|nr:hypothetical protein [Cytophagales bacterium]
MKKFWASYFSFLHLVGRKENDSNTKDKPNLSVQLFYAYRFRVCPRWCCLPTAGRHPYPQIFVEAISLITNLKIFSSWF